MKYKKRIILLILIVWVTIPGGLGDTAVDLMYFIATPLTGSITLSWETATEIDNAGFRVHRALIVAGPYESISPFIPSGPDPFLGYYYQFEDVNIEVGIQYYYKLEVIDVNGTSEYTLPVGAIIPAPTATITSTATTTLTPAATASPTLTPTATNTFLITRTATMALPTSTLTPTNVPTVTQTQTPTTTLGPLANEGINFPVSFPTITKTGTRVDDALFIPVNTQALSDNQVRETGQVHWLMVVVVLLWIILAFFLFFYIKRLSHNE